MAKNVKKFVNREFVRTVDLDLLKRLLDPYSRDIALDWSVLPAGEKQERRREFLAAHPACSSCGRIATVVDHIDPHRGDPAIFWDRSRWQSLCASCHGRKTAARDGGFANPRR